MIYIKLMTAVIIGSVVQVCTSNPLSSPVVTDPAKLCTTEELRRAKNAGIEGMELFNAISAGWTIDEMIKLRAIQYGEMKLGFEYMAKSCEVLVPGHKMASNYSSAQEANLIQVLDALFLLSEIERLRSYRTLVCSFISQPDLHPFSPNFVSHALVRWLKVQNEEKSGQERVKVAKAMCCVEGVNNVDYERIYDLEDHFKKEKGDGLPEEYMNEFEEQWSRINKKNVPESIKQMRDFLQAKNLTISDDECKTILSMVEFKLATPSTI